MLSLQSDYTSKQLAVTRSHSPLSDSLATPPKGGVARCGLSSRRLLVSFVGPSPAWQLDALEYNAPVPVASHAYPIALLEAGLEESALGDVHTPLLIDDRLTASTQLALVLAWRKAQPDGSLYGG